jgi:hypothetical protein
MHEPSDTAGMFYRADQGPDQEREDQHPGIARVREDINRTVQAPRQTGQRIELAQQRMSHPDTRGQRQDDLFAPDREHDREYGRQDGVPGRITHR